MLRSSWILNEHNLSCKIVKKLQNYRFIEGKVEQLLFEVCMIKNRHTGILLFSSDLMHKNTDKRYI